MSMPRGKTISGGYATTIDSEGINYREISEKLRDVGIYLNHSSVRNYVLRAMRKFAGRILEVNDRTVTIDELEDIARSPIFQAGIGDLLHRLN